MIVRQSHRQPRLPPLPLLPLLPQPLEALLLLPQVPQPFEALLPLPQLPPPQASAHPHVPAPRIAFGGKNSPSGKSMFRKMLHGSSAGLSPPVPEHSLRGMQ